MYRDLRSSPRTPRQDLGACLGARREELEEAIFARVHSIGDPSAAGRPEYARRLDETVGIALDHGLAVLAGELEPTDPLPEGITAQARLAARNAVALDVVLLRYLAGHALLNDFLLQEAGEFPGQLRVAMRGQAALLDRVFAAVTDAYGQELAKRSRGAGQRRCELVRQLLAGEAREATGLAYELDSWHLAVLASGAGATDALRELATALDRVLLAVGPGGAEVWAWLGGRRRLEAGELLERARAQAPPELVIAVGEPGRGLAGWRLSHRQAQSALSVAVRGSGRVVGYAEVAVLASLMRDEVLTGTLLGLYVAPLDCGRDGGAALRETLRAYFACERNVASAAAALGVSRQTASARLKAVEEKIGRSLASCATELEIALALWELRQARAPAQAD